jgi:hypothetical protein
MSLSQGKGNSHAQTSASTTTTQNTINTVDNRAVQGDFAAIGGNVTVNTGESSQIKSLNISTTDQGAVRAGLDIALQSLGGLRDIVGNTLRANSSVASDSIAQAYGLANEARQSETSGAINNFLKYGAVILVIGIIAYAVVKTKK